MMTEPDHSPTRRQHRPILSVKRPASPDATVLPSMEVARPKGDSVDFECGDIDFGPVLLSPVLPNPSSLSKLALLRQCLAYDGGVDAARLIAVTGWQIHSIRAAISRLRRKGMVIEHSNVDGLLVYRLIAPGDMT